MSITFFTLESLGAKQAMTPEGFLVCRDVPLARTGNLLYAAGEVPITPGPNGIIQISRDPQEVFHPNAIGSFIGKPVTDEHPIEKVDPNNWREHAVGVVVNARRGDGVVLDNDFLYGDLLIQDANAIAAVRAGKREVSAGYEADYEELAPGMGRQHNIIGNHVALVEKGRCGPRCAIGDHAMPTPRKLSFRDRLLNAIAQDAELVQELEKIDTMSGTAGGSVPTGDDMPDDTRHHITVNVHGASPSAAKMDAGQTHDEPDPAPNAAVPQNGGDVAAMMQQVMQRLDALESAVAAIANGEDDDLGGDPDEDGDGIPDDEDPVDNRDRRSVAGDKRRLKVRGRRGSRDELMPEQEKWARKGGTYADDVEEYIPGKFPSLPRAGTGDAAMTGDSGSMAGEWQTVMAQAEILAPGMQHPTFDAAKPPKLTMDALCTFRRRVLNNAYRTNDDARPVIHNLLGGSQANFARMTCDTIGTMFSGAAEILRMQNNRQSATSSRIARGSPIKVMTAADINAANKAFYNQK